MPIDGSVTSIIWIPSEVVKGVMKLPFSVGVAHDDDPPPDSLEGGPVPAVLEELRRDDRFRFANHLTGWIDVEDGRIASWGQGGDPLIGSTTMRAGRAVTVADGRQELDLAVASPFPHHWLYDADGRLVRKSGMIDFEDSYRHAFGATAPGATGTLRRSPPRSRPPSGASCRRRSCEVGAAHGSASWSPATRSPARARRATSSTCCWTARSACPTGTTPTGSPSATRWTTPLSDHMPQALGDGPDGPGARHDAALALADGVDVLVHDAQYTVEELPERGAFGHAAAEYAGALGEAAAARRVVLFHHDPSRTDDQIGEIVARFADAAVPVQAAVEGGVLALAALSPRSA